MVEQISLYGAPTSVADTTEIAEWVRERISAGVTVRDRFLGCNDSAELAKEFANARVLNPYDPTTGTEMLGVIRYESRVLTEPERSGGIVYDGYAIQRALNHRIPSDERSLSHLHVPLLDRVVGTWGDHDGRWHKRVSILGQPAIISVPGLYEAPARPEAYHQAKQTGVLVSGDPPPREMLEERVEGKFLVENDPRTTEVLKGYVLSAFHFLAEGEGFCDREHCRLSNPHRHSGIIRAQLEPPEFCDTHASLYTQQ